MNTKEVAKITGYSFTWCSRWAKEHHVKRVMVKGILAYVWTEEDIKHLGKKR